MGIYCVLCSDSRIYYLYATQCVEIISKKLSFCNNRLSVVCISGENSSKKDFEFEKRMKKKCRICPRFVHQNFLLADKLVVKNYIFVFEQ